MKVCVVGLGHLGQVTAACLATAHTVLGLGPRDPLGSEPGLFDLIERGEQSGCLRWGGVSVDTFRDADVVWLTEDIPVGADDRSDVEAWIARMVPIATKANPTAVIIVSSQVPVGTTDRLALAIYNERLVYFPENLRKGQAVQRFMRPDRVVIGSNASGAEIMPIKNILVDLLRPFTRHILFMSSRRAAEMTKHAINAMLAVNTALTNEIGDLCKAMDVDPREVEAGVRSDQRFGYGLPISYGGPIRGGTLLRDVRYLEAISEQHDIDTSVLHAIHYSNDCRLLEG